VGFLTLGGLFVSFMSGNTTQIGVAFGTDSPALLPVAIVAAFFLGALTGAFLAPVSLRYGRTLVLAVVTALLAASLAVLHLGGPAAASMPVLAAAMGAQNSAMVEQDGRRLGITYVTGTLATAARDLALALHGQGPSWRWLVSLLLWLAFLGGAVAGAWAHRGLGTMALAVPLAATALTLAGEATGAFVRPASR
jgi:uncharacterized membrane protein YoaK (UPF0700 family)